MESGVGMAWNTQCEQRTSTVIRHACRTLIKQGNEKVLQLFGYVAPELLPVVIEVQTPVVEFGTALQFSLTMRSNVSHKQSLMIDYVIHHQKANGTTTAKVFKWRSRSLAANGSLTLTRRHAIKKITTRTYYAGLHKVEVMVNGRSVGSGDFQLIMP